MVLNLRGSFDLQWLTVTILMNAWSIPSIWFTTRYRESQLSLTITLWLSGVVVDWTFTSGGVEMRACLFIDHCCVNVFIQVLNFAVGLNCENYFNSEIWLIYNIF